MHAAAPRVNMLFSTGVVYVSIPVTGTGTAPIAPLNPRSDDNYYVIKATHKSIFRFLNCESCGVSSVISNAFQIP